ncbi:MAG: invasion associated locus B family protein [Rhizobiaceae bacterium]
MTNGVLILPFGLRLDAGVRLVIDDGTAIDPPRFSTCRPAGCLVSLAFDVAMVTALNAGTAVC